MASAAAGAVGGARVARQCSRSTMLSLFVISLQIAAADRGLRDLSVRTADRHGLVGAAAARARSAGIAGSRSSPDCAASLIMLRPSSCAPRVDGAAAAFGSACAMPFGAIMIRTLARDGVDAEHRVLLHRLRWRWPTARVALPHWVSVQPHHWPWVAVIGAHGGRRAVADDSGVSQLTALGRGAIRIHGPAVRPGAGLGLLAHPAGSAHLGRRRDRDCQRACT